MEEILVKGGQLVLMLSILVVLHEAGHFIPAKLFKTKVEKFYLFFDPWFSIFKKKIGETTYGIGWLPLGGYVKIAGMIDESMDKDQMKEPPKPWEFRSKPAWQRLIIMLGGITVNVILAWIILTFLFASNGQQYISVDKAQENGLAFSELGKEIGFKDGDKIISVDGKSQDQFNRLTLDIMLSNEILVDRDGQKVKINISDEQIKEILSTIGKDNLMFPRTNGIVIDSIPEGNAKNAGLMVGDNIVSINGTKFSAHQLPEILEKYKKDTVTLSVKRNGQMQEIKSLVSDSATLGIVMTPPDIFVSKKYNIAEAFPVAVKESFTILAYNIKNLKLVIRPKTEAYKQVSGPLGIARKLPSTWDWGFFWNFTAMFSMWLAFVNLLPIPGLDGGHALFTLAEMITGKKLNDKSMEIVQTIGMVILLSLMALIFGKDIFDWIQDKFFK